MKNRVIRVVVLASLLLGFALLCVPLYILASILYVPDGPVSTKSPPLYPEVEDVRRREEHGFPGTLIQTVTFQTYREPDRVINFYKDVLTKDGWKIRRTSQSIQYYHYVLVGGGGPDSDPEFSMKVETNVVSSGITNVEVVLVSYPSR